MVDLVKDGRFVGRPRVQVFNDPDAPVLTKQCFKDECDITKILAKYRKTGLIDHVNRFQGHYGDFSSAQDYHASLNQVLQANDMFMTLPSDIRTRFDNDPGKFLAFVEDPANAASMVELGLKRPSAAPQGVSEELDSGSKSD